MGFRELSMHRSRLRDLISRDERVKIGLVEKNLQGQTFLDIFYNTDRCKDCDFQVILRESVK